MSTFVEMQTNVAVELYDEDHDFWTLSNIKQALNDANLDFCDRTKILRDTDTVEMAEDVPDYNVPSGCGIIMDASFGDSILPVAVLSEREMKMYFGPYWRNATGSTPRAITQTFLGPSQFTVYPYPNSSADGEDLTLRFQKTPPDTLTDDADEPEFIAEFHRALEVYACHLLLKRDIEHQNEIRAGAYLTEYVGGTDPYGIFHEGWVKRAKAYVLRSFKAGGQYVPPPDVLWG